MPPRNCCCAPLPLLLDVYSFSPKQMEGRSTKESMSTEVLLSVAMLIENIMNILVSFKTILFSDERIATTMILSIGPDHKQQRYMEEAPETGEEINLSCAYSSR